VSGRARGDKLKIRPGNAKTAARKAPACPICGKPVALETRPFCSRGCADIDLGRWLGGRYAVPGEPVEPGAVPGELEPDEDEGPDSARRTRQGGGEFL